MGYQFNGVKVKTPRGRPRTAPDQCGTLPAYARHVRAGEPIDDACRQANIDYCRKRRQAKKGKR